MTNSTSLFSAAPQHISQLRTNQRVVVLTRQGQRLRAAAHEGGGDVPAVALIKRRSLLSRPLLAAAAVVAVAAPSESALAFGSGFPGYDINVDARNRAMDRNKREMQADLDRAAAYRAKLAADKAAKLATAKVAVSGNP